ncbi:pyridoxal phosphate-dependent decarboxylase family protein [Flagellimonas lutaonensis]|uniref:Bdb protein n=1 Tax=Flagellimonas lutaonensis TaxID=516051 RepID=A0A0D5YNJ8_9FLAO|nr:pyridoxal-dependent decarboxylase [Allomuricauda lutaonensis]AKA33787.1 Bdb protein [Allomuricauda lutaonensis]
MKNHLLEEIYNPQHFTEIGHRLITTLGSYLTNTTQEKNRQTINWNVPEKEFRFWKDFLESGQKEDFFDEVLKRTTHTHHPKYVGHQVAAPAPITALTGMVSSLLNNGMAIYEMGMAPSAIERVVTDMLCEQIGYGEHAAGFLTSGGTLANLTALLSARKARVEHDVWNKGYSQSLGIMVCEEAHYCIDRAAKIMGLGQKGIIKIPAGDDFSMDISKLNEYFERETAKGIHIFAIVGSAPSTATGAHDYLDAIAQFAAQKNLWFHVDGAHGGAAVYSKKYRHLLNGIELADSVVIDGHKMMLMPTITTALLFKNRKHAQHTFSQKADYLLNDSEEDEWFNSGKKTFECTKTMMALHWFILLKFYGEQVFDRFVTRQYNLARTFAQLVREHPNFDLAIEPSSNILCFRYRPSDTNASEEELNELNAAVRQRLLEDGEYYLVQTRLRGTHYLRTTLMNPFTHKEHLALLLDKIVKTANVVARDINS